MYNWKIVYESSSGKHETIIVEASSIFDACDIAFIKLTGGQKGRIVKIEQIDK